MAQNNSNAVIPLLINNESVVTDIKFEVHAPATGELSSYCAGASVDDAVHAIESAKAAFPAWSKTKAYDRRDILFKAAEVMIARKEELIAYQQEETGAGRPFPKPPSKWVSASSRTLRRVFPRSKVSCPT